MRRTIGFVIRCWIPVAVWLAIIALESTRLLSSANTSSILYRLAVAVFGHVNVHEFEVVHAALRKCGHFAGYAILSLLFFRALRATFDESGLPSTRRLYAGWVVGWRRWAAPSIVMTFLVASADEFHQVFLPSRTGTFHDVLIDTAGAVCMQLILLAGLQRRNRRMLSECDRKDVAAVITLRHSGQLPPQPGPQQTDASDSKPDTAAALTSPVDD